MLIDVLVFKILRLNITVLRTEARTVRGRAAICSMLGVGTPGLFTDSRMPYRVSCAMLVLEEPPDRIEEACCLK